MGAIPAGFANTGGYTATVEVVVAAAADVEITAFDAIADKDGGKVGAATYADAAAVIAALPTDVTANSNAVTVPVTTWVDTDSYDPAVAGSYTFTATLGAIPAGFANTGGYTATVEVVVYAATFTSQTDNSISNDVATLGLVGNQVSSLNSSVATGAIESDKIKITSIAQGSTTIKVKGALNYEAKIAVTVAVDGTITIGAITKPALNVTYHITGGSGTVPTQAPLTSGDTFTVASPTGLTAPTGKQFKEWNTSHIGIGTAMHLEVHLLWRHQM